MENENWRPIPEWEDLYEVSDLGRVRSRDRTVRPRASVSGRTAAYVRRSRGKVLRPAANPAGYLHVNLRRDGVPTSRDAHTLVLEAFVGPRPRGADACHGNGDPGDNRLTNLRWDTVSENRLDTVRHGRHPLANRTHCPRGHVLAAPNLVASTARQGRRNCLACSRGGAAVQRGAAAELQAASDAYYAEIMRAAA